MGMESYDAVLTRSPSFGYLFFDYTISMPGSTPVEDLPEVRSFDSEEADKVFNIVLWSVIGGGLLLALFIIGM